MKLIPNIKKGYRWVRFSGNSSGVTMIELSVAMAVTGILIGIIFGLWGNIDRHIIKQRRKSVIQAETRQIATSLASQLRRSPAILAWHANGITYVSPTRGDTVVYEYYAEQLLKNDVPVSVVSQTAYVSDFSIVQQYLPQENPALTVLTITLALADDFSNAVTVSSTVAVMIASQDGGEADDVSGWNF